MELSFYDLRSKKKSSYSLVFFYGDDMVLFLKYVNSGLYVERWLKGKGLNWSLCQVYDRRSGEFLGWIRNMNIMPLYKMAFFHNKKKVLNLNEVYSIKNAVKWALKRGVTWSYVNIYDYLQGTYVKRIYLNNLPY